MEQNDREMLVSFLTGIQCQLERIEVLHDGNRLMTVVDRLRGDYNVAANRQIMLLERIEGHLATLARPSSRFVVETLQDMRGPKPHGFVCLSSAETNVVAGRGDMPEAAALDFDAKWTEAIEALSE